MKKTASIPQPEETHVLPEIEDRAHVPDYLESYGYSVSSDLQWKAAPNDPPKLSLEVSGHSTVDGYTYYLVECALRLPPRDGSEELTLCWRAGRRLAQLRTGLHDPVKKELGDRYKGFFGGTPFATHLKTAGTSSRLNEWCGSLARCISAGTVPPVVAAVTLRSLGAPDANHKEGPQSRWRDLRRQDDADFVGEAMGREALATSRTSRWSSKGGVQLGLGREAVAEEISASIIFPDGIEFSVDEACDAHTVDSASTHTGSCSPVHAKPDLLGVVIKGRLAQGVADVASETGSSAGGCSLRSEDVEGYEGQRVLRRESGKE